MPRVRRRPKLKTMFHDGYLMQLVTGFDFFGDAYGDGDRRDLARMAADYTAHRDEVFAYLAERSGQGRGMRLRPWSYYVFDLRMDPDDVRREREEELEVLRSRGLPTSDERRALCIKIAQTNGGD